MGGRHDIKAGDLIYPFYWEEDAQELLRNLARSVEADRFFVISDESILSAHGPRLLPNLSVAAPLSTCVIEKGESAKGFSTLQTLCEAALSAGVTRRSVIVALGGGAVGNVSGLAAGLLFRGIRLLHIPTTPMAAFDSVLSLKQAINVLQRKNVVGLYHAPEAVILDLKTFSTLHERELQSGIGETIKNVVAIAPERYDSVAAAVQPERQRELRALEVILATSIEAKLKVLKADPFEKNEALILEYGHTVGHAVEMADYCRRGSDGLRHGEAVAVGMRVAAEVSRALGGATARPATMQEELFCAARMSPRVPSGLEVAEITHFLRGDNKRGRVPQTDDEIAMVLLEDIGRPRTTNGVPLISVPIQVVAEQITEAK
jgi:3-dehydroquinate synthase/2-deoxy-scyllo-inosose synthase